MTNNVVTLRLESLAKQWAGQARRRAILALVPLSPKASAWAEMVTMEVAPDVDNPLHTSLHCPDHGQFATLDIPGVKLLRSQFDERLDVLEQMMVKHWLAKHERITLMN